MSDEDIQGSLVYVKPGDELFEQVCLMTSSFCQESELYHDMDFNISSFGAWLTNIFNNLPTRILTYVKNGVALGYTVYTLEENFQDKTNFEVITLYVPKEARKLGVGRALVEATARDFENSTATMAQVSICAKLKGDTDLINKLTENLYAKCGFEKVGIVMARKK